MLMEPKSKLVMIGDSITDCERARPYGEGLFGAIGKGYVSLVDALLTAAYPELGIRVVNMGTSGNTVRDLSARWQSDVLDLKPDWLSVMIGINDVWRQYDLPAQIEAKRILIIRDPVIRQMLEGLGAEVSEVLEPFQPIRGAYHAGGHNHGHGHHHG